MSAFEFLSIFCIAYFVDDVTRFVWRVIRGR